MNQSINQVFLEILGKMYLTFFVSLHSFIFAEINFFRRVFHSETVFMSESPSFFTYKEIGLTLSGPTVCKKVHPQFLLLRKAINRDGFYRNIYLVFSQISVLCIHILSCPGVFDNTYVFDEVVQRPDSTISAKNESVQQRSTKFSFISRQFCNTKMQFLTIQLVDINSSIISSPSSSSYSSSGSLSASDISS